MRRRSGGEHGKIVREMLAGRNAIALRGRLAAAVRDYEQVLITAAVLGDVPDEFATHVIRIKAGRILGPEES